MLKNKSKFFALALSAMALVGCSYVVEPTDYRKPLVQNVDKTAADILNNEYSDVYDKLVNDGTVNTTIFNNIMNRIAKAKLPEYYGENGFMTEAEFNAEVEKLVNEKLYNLISSDSYKVNGKFDERVFAIDLMKQFYEVKSLDHGYNRDTVFTPETKNYALEENHLGGGATFDADNILFNDYSDYKERHLKKEVYQELLFTKYLEDNSYSNIGRAYARKVSYIAISKDTKHPEAAKKTIDAFLAEYVSKPEANVDLNNLSKLWKGVDYSNVDHALDPELTSMKETYGLRTLADNIEDDYLKIMDFDGHNYTPKSKDLTDTALESEFTKQYTQSAAKGKEDKDIELAKKELVTEGWFVKNGGLTELPSAIRTRLFDIRTASDFQKIKAGNAENLYKFVREINGVTYLVPQVTESTEKDSDIVFYDRESSTYYIVVIEDALNSSSLNLANIEDAAAKKEIRKNAHEVAKMLGVKDSNKSQATTHYLKEANIVFHDEDIYNYFKESYSDAFADDKKKDK